MYWMVYRGGVVCPINKVWYPVGTTAQDVYEDLFYNYDFDILIKPDSED